MPRPDVERHVVPRNAAMRWFGDDFARLHPLLQALHRDGGCLRGEVGITTGTGMAGLIGRRLARRWGLPLERSRCGFHVLITHDEHAMRWERRFDNGTRLVSLFRPCGRYPRGHWMEDTGRVRLQLGVELVDGGWHWRLRGASLAGVPLPRWLFPRTDAFKCIEDGGTYRFGVALSLFPFGRLIAYEGRLRAEPAAIA